MRLLSCSTPVLILIFCLLVPSESQAAPQKEFIIVSGGPSLLSWENYRLENDRHDIFWGNFIATAVFRMRQIREANGPNTIITWLVYRKAYEARGRAEGKPLTTWIKEKEAKEGCRVVWFDTGGDIIRYLNSGKSRRKFKIANFEYFGHSNRHAWMFDYSSDVLGASSSWLHEGDLKKIRKSAFLKDAHVKSWGCYTGESMSKWFRAATGIHMWGALKKTDYSPISEGKLPRLSSGIWTR